MEREQPDDEEERPPWPAGEEAAARGAQGLANEDAPAATLEPLGEVEVLQEPEVAVAAEFPEDRRPHEDALIAVVVAGDPVAHAIDVGDQPQAGRALGEEVLERASHRAAVGQGLRDQPERVRRWGRIGVEEEQHVAARDRGAGIHQRGARRPARPDEPRAAGDGPLGAVGVAPRGHDDLAGGDVPEAGEVVE